MEEAGRHLATARVLVNQIDRNINKLDNSYIDNHAGLEKKLIKRLDLGDPGRGEGGGASRPPSGPPPYSVVVTPATPQAPPPPRPAQNNFAPQPLNPKSFYLADAKLPPLCLPPSAEGGLGRGAQAAPQKPGGQGARADPVHGRCRSSSGMIECTSLELVMTDRSHQTAQCSATEKQVRERQEGGAANGNGRKEMKP